MHPDKAHERRDPVAMSLVAGVHMPALGVADEDASDLIAFLQAETTRLDEARDPPMPAHMHHHH